jgi:hypothetical protein
VTAAYSHVPDGVSSLAVPGARVAEMLGRKLDPEQVWALDVLTRMDADGYPAALISCAISPRQNVKTWLMQVAVLTNLLRKGGSRKTIWTAHLFKTADNTFDDFDQLIKAHKWLWALVERIDRANGEQAITFRGGRELQFMARSGGAGRGFSGDEIVLDEAYALKSEHMGALMPILSTRRNARVWVGSSAGMPQSVELRAVRDRGRAGGQGAPAYVEYCAPGSYARPGCASDDCTHIAGMVKGCALDREDYWLQANIAARVSRIPISYLQQERVSLSWREFARERLGWWEDPLSAEELGPLWAECLDVESRPVAWPVGFAVDTSQGLAHAVVAAAGYREDGLPHVEVLQTQLGTDWLVDFLQPRVWEHGATVRILGGSTTAKAIVPALKKSSIPYVETPMADYAAACGLVAKEMRDKRLRHLDDTALRVAIEGATSVTVGDDGAFRWSAAKSDTDITALAAVTLARWQLEQQALNPGDDSDDRGFG